MLNIHGRYAIAIVISNHDLNNTHRNKSMNTFFINNTLLQCAKVNKRVSFFIQKAADMQINLVINK